MKFTLKEFERVYNEISSVLEPTPLVKNEWLSAKYDANIYLKLENLQPVGSFKLRGAYNKIASLSKEEMELGVLAVSAGNHAQGVAWAARKFDIPATIIMPENSPIVKIQNTKSLGAEVILKGNTVDESFEFAKEYLKKHKKTYIHPFHDKDVILGQGSMGLELKKQIDHVDFLFGSIGGGGLMSGVGYVTKQIFKDIKVIGTQAFGANSMILSLQKGKLTKSSKVRTFADGIKVQNPNEQMFNTLDEIIDEAISVQDTKIATAVLDLIEQARVIAEGAAAINLAGFKSLYEENPRRFKGKNIVLIICGGNIDVNLIDRIIERGLIESKRRVHIDLKLDDRPGALKLLSEKISSTTANVLQVEHDRNAKGLLLGESIVRLILETKGPDHADKIIEYLKQDYEVL